MQLASTIWNDSTESLKWPAWNICQQDEHAGQYDQHLVLFSACKLCLVAEILGLRKLVGLRQILKEAPLSLP